MHAPFKCAQVPFLGIFGYPVKYRCTLTLCARVGPVEVPPIEMFAELAIPADGSQTVAATVGFNGETKTGTASADDPELAAIKVLSVSIVVDVFVTLKLEPLVVAVNGSYMAGTMNVGVKAVFPIGPDFTADVPMGDFQVQGDPLHMYLVGAGALLLLLCLCGCAAATSSSGSTGGKSRSSIIVVHTGAGPAPAVQAAPPDAIVNPLAVRAGRVALAAGGRYDAPGIEMASRGGAMAASAAMAARTATPASAAPPAATPRVMTARQATAAGYKFSVPAPR